MASRESLEARAAQCSGVDDLAALAREALADPADPDYARELLNQAEMQCRPGNSP